MLIRKNFGSHSLSSLSRTLLNKRVLGSNPGGKLCPHTRERAKDARAFSASFAKLFAHVCSEFFPPINPLFEEFPLRARGDVARDIARQSPRVPFARARRFPAPAARAVLSGSRS